MINLFQPEQHPHLRWRRLETTAPRRRSPAYGVPRGPLRRDRQAHADQLQDQWLHVVGIGATARAAAGIDPGRLRVLEFTFIDANQRQWLDRLGLNVLSEQAISQPVDQIGYRLRLRFDDADKAQQFTQADLAGSGVFDVQGVRASDGSVDPSRLDVLFTSRHAALAFGQDAERSADLGFASTTTVQRIATRTSYRIVVQFRNQDDITAFEAERAAYSQGAPLQLTAIQAAELFDSLENVTLLERDDRRGPLLGTAGIPAGPSYLDVDLWHPGEQGLVDEAIVQFRQVVANAGGRVTDGPRVFAESLLLARVHGEEQLLEALLDYDRVACVDLPPVLTDGDVSILDAVQAPVGPLIPPDGSPVACVIDSGVIAGHPMLSGTVLEERDFGTNEGSVSDLDGHGTAIAGLLIYGDISACIARNEWQPQVRLLSGKVLRRGDGHPEFSDETMALTQIDQTIRAFSREYGCRVFNLSIGHQGRVFHGGRQLAWAQALDHLARELDIVLVIPTGNVGRPDIPLANTEQALREAIRETLLGSDEHHLIDPATAGLALSVGSIARSDQPSQGNEGHRERIAAAPARCPSPFTRVGIVASSGSGLMRAVKPDLAAYGGNYCIWMGGNWTTNDPRLGEPTLRIDYQGGRPLIGRFGSSFAAPQVTYCCALVEAELGRIARDELPSANLIRALTVHSADWPEAAEAWLSAGFSEGESEFRLLRTVGYGLPDVDRARFSADNRVTLLAEDALAENYLHVYELRLPAEFHTMPGTRTFRVTLAYDPPMRATRQEYFQRTMWFTAYRGLTSEAVIAATSAAQGTGTEPRLSPGQMLPLRPPQTVLEWSTVQSAVYSTKRPSPFNHRPADDEAPTVHILVGCKNRIPPELDEPQRYALVVTLEHSNDQIQLYQVVQQQIQQRVAVPVRLGAH